MTSKGSTEQGCAGCGQHDTHFVQANRLPVHEFGDNERRDEFPYVLGVRFCASRLAVGEPVVRGLSVLAFPRLLTIGTVRIGFCDNSMALDEKVENG